MMVSEWRDKRRRGKEGVSMLRMFCLFVTAVKKRN